MEERVFSIVEGCGGARLYSLSDEAAAAYGALPEDVQAEIREGFIRFYGKAMRLLVNMQMSTFSPLEDSLSLTALSQENVVLDIKGYALVCKFNLNDEYPLLEIVKIKEPGALALYRSQKL